MGAAERLPELYTEADAAAYLDVSEITLRRFRKRASSATSASARPSSTPSSIFELSGATDVSTRFRIGDYWLEQRKGSTVWYRAWIDTAGCKQRATLGTKDIGEAK